MATGGSGGHWDGVASDDLPQMDGTCDACEPDEPQPAEWVCARCCFAFCTAHGTAHTRSTTHTLLPYTHTQEEELRPEGEGPVAEGEEPVSEEQQATPQSSRHRDPVSVERLKCKDHGQEGSLYCRHDQRIICVLCAVQGEHRDHDIITLREAYLWQKSKEGIDLLEQTQEIAERIKAKWTSPDMSVEELELYVNAQFDELQRLVRVEEWRVLHLVDLKEAFLTAQASEKISEISAHTDRLQEEMDSITQQLQQLDRMETDGVAPASLAPLLRERERAPDPDLRLRAVDPRRNQEDPSADEDAHVGHTP